MPTFILAGHQRGLAKKVDEAIQAGSSSGRLHGWEACQLHSRLQNQSILEASQVAQVLEEAQRLNGAHVFGVSVSRTRVEIARSIKSYFRFRWIDPTAIGQTAQGHFEPLIEELERAILEEDVWVEHVKPSDPASPLALPNGLFKTKGEFSNLWARCEGYGDVEAIRATGTLIHKFTTTYRKTVDTRNEKTPWLDEDDWVWKDGGEEHGKAPFPKNWKYSWSVPERFHFDVMPKKPKAKTYFMDINGVQHKLPKESKYMNVTVHGEVRGFKENK